jgi:hypothetical protein
MAFVLIVIGIVIFVTALNGTTGQLGSLLVSDTFGQGGFAYWALAVFIAGAIGYYKPAKTFSDLLVALLIITLLLSNGGVLGKISQAFASASTTETNVAPQAATTAPTSTAATAVNTTSQSSTNSPDDLGNLLGVPEPALGDPLGFE